MRLPQYHRRLLVSCLPSLLLALGPGPASAAPCSDFDMVAATFLGHGATVYIIPSQRLQLVVRDAEDLTGARYSGVTRGFLVPGEAELVLGFEIGGCLIDPIRIKAPPQYTAAIGAA